MLALKEGKAVDEAEFREHLRRTIQMRCEVQPNEVVLEPLEALAPHRVETGERLHGVPPELDAHRLLGVRGPDLDRIAPCPKFARAECGVVSFIVNADQVMEDALARIQLPFLQGEPAA